MIAKMISRIVEKATNEVKQELEKKGSEKCLSISFLTNNFVLAGMKRIHMYQMEETATGKKPRARRRNSIPVFHFKQTKPNEPVQIQPVETVPSEDE
jgi:hypothetical protein